MQILLCFDVLLHFSHICDDIMVGQLAVNASTVIHLKIKIVLQESSQFRVHFSVQTPETNYEKQTGKVSKTLQLEI